MDDKELLEKADEFLNMAWGDGKEQCLMYKMKSRLEELTTDKKEPEPQPKSIVWVPKKGERYFVVLSDGEVYTHNWQNSDYELALLKHHNVYKTRVQAVRAAEYQKRYNMVLQAVINLEPDQVVDWKNEHQLKYTVYFDHERGIWGYGSSWTIEIGYPVLTDPKNVKPLLDYLNAKEQQQ